MLEVTQAATHELSGYFKDKKKSPMRIFLKEKACGGPRLVLGIDQQKNSDEVFELAGFTFIIDRDFLTQIQPVKVDFTNNSFQVTGAVPFSSSCGECNSGGSCR